MQDHLIIQLTNNNNIIIETYGDIEDVHKVFNSFILETQKYTIVQLEQYSKLKLNIICRTNEIKVKLPDDFIRFSNLWDAPIYIHFNDGKVLSKKIVNQKVVTDREMDRGDEQYHASVDDELSFNN